MTWTSEQIAEYMAQRARPYERKRVWIRPNDEFKPKSANPTTLEDGKLWVEFSAGLCPCAVCGHACMGECDEAGCECCSELCS